MQNTKNGTNHEETGCEMSRTESKLHRIVLWSVWHLCNSYFGCSGWCLHFAVIKTTQLSSLFILSI